MHEKAKPPPIRRSRASDPTDRSRRALDPGAIDPGDLDPGGPIARIARATDAGLSVPVAHSILYCLGARPTLRQDTAMTSRDSSHAAGHTDAHTATPPARALGEFVAGLRLSDVPAPVRARALQLMLDAIGVGLAARRYPFAERSLAAAMALGGSEGTSTVIGHSERLPLRDAALVNGVLLHGFGFRRYAPKRHHPPDRGLPADGVWGGRS